MGARCYGSLVLFTLKIRLVTYLKPCMSESFNLNSLLEYLALPVKMADPPSVQLSFANNFWGKEDAGVSPLLERMHNAKVTGDELKAFYTGTTIASQVFVLE